MSLLTTIGIARAVQVHPQGDEKKFSIAFLLGWGKMGLNLVRCTPADEIKKTVVCGSI